jgi:hypothetical protein
MANAGLKRIKRTSIMVILVRQTKDITSCVA